MALIELAQTNQTHCGIRTADTADSRSEVVTICVYVIGFAYFPSLFPLHIMDGSPTGPTDVLVEASHEEQPVGLKISINNVPPLGQ